MYSGSGAAKAGAAPREAMPAKIDSENLLMFIYLTPQYLLTPVALVSKHL
jgi:hypothetical protein